MNMSDAWQDLAQALGVPADLLPSTSDRIHHVEGLERDDPSDPVNGFAVEAWAMREAVSELFEARLAVLTTRMLDTSELVGRCIRLRTTLADGGSCYRSGIIFEARRQVFETRQGQLLRFFLTVVPEGRLLQETVRSQVWQDQGLPQILGDLLRPAARMAWRLDPGLPSFLAQGNDEGRYAYRVQYRESNWHAIEREAAREGLAYCWVEDEEAPAKHGLRFAFDTASSPEDPTSAALDGVEVQREHGSIGRDVIMSLGRRSEIQSTMTTLIGWDPETKSIVAGASPTRKAMSELRLEEYWDEGEAFSSSAAAEHYAQLRRDAKDCQAELVFGHSTLRTLRSGTTLRVRGRHDLLGVDVASGQLPSLLLVRVDHAGVSNLGSTFEQVLVESTGAAGADLLEDLRFEGMDQTLLDQAEDCGYGNRFEAVDARVSWRPEHAADRSSVEFEVATVVGPNGEAAPSPELEIYRNARGDVRLRFDWQQGERADDCNTCWVAVAQISAMAEGGSAFVPRIGQRVLVGFVDGNPESPYVRGALYTGRGEGGIDPTPGGGAAATAGSPDVFKSANDASPAGQGNLIAAGNSPAWHGGAAEAHHNPAALSGVKTQEFGGTGFVQSVFDDTDGQQRVQFGTTQHASWLTLGHLRHQQDNYLGSFRGTGWELFGETSGAVRGTRGLMLTTYGQAANEPGGGNAAGQALARQMLQLAQCLDGAAASHQTVRLGSALPAGSEAPMVQALNTVLDGMASAASFDAAIADAGKSCTDAGADGKVPHVGEPILGVMARAGQALVAGQDLVVAAGQALHVSSGQDTTRAVGGEARVHTGQAIGVLGGATKPGDQASGTGLTMIAGHGDVQMQAQGGPVQLAAKGMVDVMSAHGNVNWAAAKKITLQNAAGSMVELSQAGFNAGCPGKITVHAASKSFMGGGAEDYPLPKLPLAPTKPVPLQFDLVLTSTPGPEGLALIQHPWQVVRINASAPDRIIVQGKTDDAGKLSLTAMQALRLSVALARWPGQLELWTPGSRRPFEQYLQAEPWSSNDQNLRALAALDFADVPGMHSATQQSRMQRARAAEATGESRSYNFFEKLS